VSVCAVNVLRVRLIYPVHVVVVLYSGDVTRVTDLAQNARRRLNITCEILRYLQRKNEQRSDM